MFQEKATHRSLRHRITVAKRLKKLIANKSQRQRLNIANEFYFVIDKNLAE